MLTRASLKDHRALNTPQRKQEKPAAQVAEERGLPIIGTKIFCPNIGIACQKFPGRERWWGRLIEVAKGMWRPAESKAELMSPGVLMEFPSPPCGGKMLEVHHFSKGPKVHCKIVEADE